MPLGFGLAPFGTSIFGYGSPDKAQVDRTAIYSKKDGSEGTARLIDPKTRDYVLTDTGRFVGADEVEQAVYLALTTVKGTSILSSLGQAFTSLQTKGDNLQRRVEDEVNVALNDLIQADIIELISVEIETELEPLVIKVEWRDVETDSLKETVI